MRKNTIVVVALAIVAVLLIWYFALRSQPTNRQPVAPQAQSPSVNVPSSATTTQSLGGRIYQQTKNPLSNKLPDVNPVKNANPLQGVYTNPF